MRPFWRFLRTAIYDSFKKGFVIMLVLTGLVPVLLPIAQHLDKHQEEHTTLWANLGGYWSSLFYIIAWVAVVWIYLAYACYKLYEKRQGQFVESNKKFLRLINQERAEALIALEKEKAARVATEEERDRLRKELDEKELTQIEKMQRADDFIFEGSRIMEGFMGDAIAANKAYEEAAIWLKNISRFAAKNLNMSTYKKLHHEDLDFAGMGELALSMPEIENATLRRMAGTVKHRLEVIKSIRELF